MSKRNENRPGYKKTKVGWIPREWTSIALCEIGVMRSGGTPSKEIAAFWKGNIPWFTAKDLKSFRLKTSQDTISEEGLLKGSRLAPAGSILILVRGMTLFRDLPVGVLDVPAGFNQDIKVIEPLKGFDPLFAGYAITARKEMLKRLVEHAGHGTGRIDTGLLQGCLFPFPPYKEQKKIVEILSTWDTAIEQIRKLIDAKKRLKKALMQQLLTGTKRLPGFGALDWEEKQVPDGWQEIKLSQAFKRVQRITKPDVKDVLSITATVGFVQQKDKFSRVIAGQNLERYILLRKGEFAYNKGNSKSYPQGCVYTLEDFDETAVPNVYFCFRPRNTEIIGNFYKFYFENSLLNHQLQKVINTGVRNDGLLNLHPNDFFNIRIKVPPIYEQKRITTILSTATNEINNLEKKLKVLER